MTFPIRQVDRAKMQDTRSMILHGVYLLLYSPFKYLSFPFSNYLRSAVLKLFSRRFDSTYIADGCLVWFPWRLSVGRNVSINQGTIIDATGDVEIHDGVRIASYVYLNTADHEYADWEQPIHRQGFRVAPVVIEEDVWIGAHACINKGVRIGRGAIVGSGAVVTKDIEPMTINVGVPSRVIGRRGPLPASDGPRISGE